MKGLFFLFFFLLNLAVFGQNPKEVVYEKERLIILKENVEVFGTIMFIKGELDGDYHFRLKLSEEADSLLVKNNFKYQDSCLVLEIVCGKGSFHTICNGYTNLIPLPKIGDYVRVTGDYVFDKRHRWTEIHPVIEMITVTDLWELDK